MRWFKRAEPREPDQDFVDLLTEHGLASYERQAAFEQRIGDLDWQLDQERGVLMLGEQIILRAQILGSEAVKARTWLWAWANESVDHSLAVKAAEVRSIGEQRGLSFLTEPQIDTERTGDGYLLALATTGLLGADPYYPCPYPGGVAYVLVDLANDALDLGPVTAERIVDVISLAIQDAPRLVSRRSIERYLAGIGADATWEGDGVQLGGSARLTFDELGRLTSIEGVFERSP
jgi:hypothetical protein